MSLNSSRSDENIVAMQSDNFISKNDVTRICFKSMSNSTLLTPEAEKQMMIKIKKKRNYLLKQIRKTYLFIDSILNEIEDYAEKDKRNSFIKPKENVKLSNVLNNINDLYIRLKESKNELSSINSNKLLLKYFKDYKNLHSYISSKLVLDNVFIEQVAKSFISNANKEKYNTFALHNNFDKTAFDIGRSYNELKKYKHSFMQSNLRLVISIARYYFGRTNIEFLDLVQEGSIGLMRAIDKFDPDYNYRFSTYATWWIKQAIQRYSLEYAKIIRMPSHIAETSMKIAKEKSKLEKEEIDINTDSGLEKLSKITGLAEDKIRDVKMSMDTKFLSLDAYIQDSDEGDTFVELISGDIPTPEEATINNINSKYIMEAMKELKEQEQRVILYRYGFMGEKYSLQEIADILGISRERVRQLEKKAIKILRENLKEKML